MEGPQVKLPLVEVTKALKANDSNKKLKALAKTGLEQMAERHNIEVSLVLPLLDELVEKIIEEGKKFNPRLPYPPVTANNMSVQVEMPIKGRIGIVEHNTAVSV